MSRFVALAQTRLRRMSQAAGELTPEFLARSDLFRGLPPSALADAARQGRRVHHPRGTHIFSQGEPVAHAHLAMQGRVKIVQSGPGGEQLIVRFIRPGESFGTLGLYIDGLYPAEAVAVGDATEVRWSVRTFTALVQKHPEIALNLLRLVGARLQEMQTRLRELSTDRVEQRVASALLRVTLQERAGDGGVQLPLSRRDIAELAGTTVYTASRVLTGWQRQGIVTSGRASVTILLPEAITAISSGQR